MKQGNRMKQFKLVLLLTPISILGALFLSGVCNGILQSFGYIPAFGLTVFTDDYYQEIFRSATFVASLKVSLWISIVSSVLAGLIGVLLCVALLSHRTISSRIMPIFSIPILVPHTIVAFFMITILSQNGFLARVLYQMSLLDSQQSFPQFLFHQNQFGIILAYLWKEIPFVAYFILSIMSSINGKWGEAAENLGANPIKAFFEITLPLCMPTIKKAMLIIFSFSFGAYELPFLLGSTIPKALPVQAYVEYMNPDLLHRPYAMAMNGIMLIAGLIVAVGYFLIQKTTWEREGKYNE